MVCGEDAHGGNIQSGCHQKFFWSEAQPYQAQLASFSEHEMALLQQASLMQKQSHPGIPCQICGKTEIHGVRFRCIRCPGIDICGECTFVSNEVHPCEFEVVQGVTGSAEQQLSDPRLSDWGCFMYPLHDDLVWVVLHADPDPWNFRLQLRRTFQCEAGFKLFETELRSQLGQQLRRRYRICEESTTGPAVAAVSPKSHKVLASWVGQERTRRFLCDPDEALCEALNCL